MPSIDNLNVVRSKKFEKKAYRPWDNQFLEDVNEKKEDNVVLDILDSFDSPKSMLTSKISLEKIDRELFGVQKSVLLLFIANIVDSNEEFAYTKPFSNEELCSSIKAPISSIKVSIGRLKKKGILQSNESKPGRGGYSSFKVPLSVYEYFKIT